MRAVAGMRLSNYGRGRVEGRAGNPDRRAPGRGRDAAAIQDVAARDRQTDDLSGRAAEGVASTAFRPGEPGGTGGAGARYCDGPRAAPAEDAAAGSTLCEATRSYRHERR